VTRFVSTAGHHCEVVLIGDVLGWVRSPLGHLTGVVVALDVEGPTTVPILLNGGVHGLRQGDRVAVRGTLVSEKCPGERQGLMYLKPRRNGFEVLKQRPGESHG
jgi:hypothetical protein